MPKFNYNVNNDYSAGAFRVEMQRESQKDRTILCRYDPTEVNDYIFTRCHIIDISI